MVSKVTLKLVRNVLKKWGGTEQTKMVSEVSWCPDI